MILPYPCASNSLPQWKIEVLSVVPFVHFCAFGVRCGTALRPSISQLLSRRVAGRDGGDVKNIRQNWLVCDGLVVRARRCRPTDHVAGVRVEASY